MSMQAKRQAQRGTANGIRRKATSLEQATNAHPAAALQRMSSGPSSAVSAHDVETVQRSMGNQVVQRVLSDRTGSTVQRKPTKAEQVIETVKQYDKYIAEASQKYGIPIETIRAIIATESKGVATASSGAAFGLMQITKGTWKGTQEQDPDLKSYDFTEANWQDPRINIMFGTAVFKAKMKAVGIKATDEGSAELAVLAYNAGEGTVKKAIANAKAAGSKNPGVDCLLPEHLKPAIKATGIYSYYLTGKGKSRNPAALVDPKSDAALETAIDLKFKEVSNYPSVVRSYLAAQGGKTTTPTPQTTTPTTTAPGGGGSAAKKPAEEPGLVDSFVSYISSMFKSDEPATQPAQAPQKQAMSKERMHTVKAGETLEVLSAQFGVSAAELKKANADKLKQWKKGNGVIEGFNAGETIRIPAAQTTATTTPTPQAAQGPGLVEQASNLAESAMKSVTAGAETISKWIFGDDNAAPTPAGTGAKAGASASAGATATVGGKTAATGKATGGVAYESQRDNTYNNGTVYGDNMCNVTTLAMQLETLAGDKQSVVEAAVNLLKTNGHKADRKELLGKQLEDLLMLRFDQLGADFFVKKFGIDTKVAPPHQWATCLGYVGSEFKGYVSKSVFSPDTKKHALCSQDYYKKVMLPALQQGGSVMISTNLTGGHIILLVGVEDQGIIVNDPYGMFMLQKSDYIKNGAAVADKKTKVTGNPDKIKTRLQHNTGMLDTVNTLVAQKDLKGKTFPQNLGERNFFTWQEVEDYKVGKWVNVLYPNKDKVEIGDK